MIEKKYFFLNSPRCGASTKNYNGRPCRSPAVQGKKRCRMHGGSKGSGARAGNTNALKHGYTTDKAKRFRKEIKTLLSSLSKSNTRG